MVKKYFALSIIALSVAIAGCSSDDDDEGDGGDGGNGGGGGGGTDPVVPIVGSGLAAIADSPDHARLEALVTANASLTAALNAADGTFTVFAPNDAAFEAYDALVAAGEATTEDASDDLMAVADIPEATMERILQAHVLSGNIQTPFEAATIASLAVADDTAEPALVAQELTLAGGVTVGEASDANTVTITGGEAVVVDSSAVGTEADVLDADQDVIHIISTLLVPSDVDLSAPEDTGTGGGGGGDNSAAGAIATLLDGETETYDNALAGIITAYGAAFDTAQWTLFLPNDTVATAELTEAATVGHAISTPFDEAALEAQIGSSIQNANSASVSGNSYTAAEIAVDGATGAITVGGNAVTYIGQVSADGGTTLGAHVYSIAAALPDAAAQ